MGSSSSMTREEACEIVLGGPVWDVCTACADKPQDPAALFTIHFCKTCGDSGVVPEPRCLEAYGLLGLEFPPPQSLHSFELAGPTKIVGRRLTAEEIKAEYNRVSSPPLLQTVIKVDDDS